MSEEYLSDVLPAPRTILGKRLAGLSLGHALLLQRFGCYPAQGYGGLITGVIVCSRPVREVLPALADRWLPFKLWVWGRRVGKFDVAQKLNDFNEYLRENSRRPELLPFEYFSESGLPGAPELQHLRVTLLSRCGWTDRMIEEETLSQAYWDYYTYWEIEDKVRIATAATMAEQEGLVEEANRLHEERLAQANEKLKAEEEAGRSATGATMGGHGEENLKSEISDFKGEGAAAAAQEAGRSATGATSEGVAAATPYQDGSPGTARPTTPEELGGA